MNSEELQPGPVKVPTVDRIPIQPYREVYLHLDRCRPVAESSHLALHATEKERRGEGLSRSRQFVGGRTSVVAGNELL